MRRAFHDFVQALQRLGAVHLLAAVLLRLDHQLAGARQALVLHLQQPRLEPFRQRRGGDVEAQVHRARDLVDVLPARAGGTHRGQFDFAFGDNDFHPHSHPLSPKATLTPCPASSATPCSRRANSLVTAGPFLLLALALLAGAYYFLKPAPPKRVVLATGSGPGRLRGLRQALPGGTQAPRHRGGAAPLGRLAREPAPAARPEKRRADRVRAGRLEPLAADAGAGKGGRRHAAAVARQHVLRAGVAVLPRPRRRRS